MKSNFTDPINIGSEEMISINNLVKMIIAISGKEIYIQHIDGPTGVRGRNSDNRLILQALQWQPNYALSKGMETTYRWIEAQIKKTV